ncbi:protein C9orf135 [Lingula anatina]|uniref:Protein C9orf135 n=1 Tax=Lingula anatina TaxID=7574 RepID=A0A1S3IK36_LINAN|nr:protein C9orf135 [Lingula anatina]|eukprot:XP_013398605.1 protein C9orf135 [Lingula anatina]
MATGITGLPDYIERKGSLFLRSNHMNYARATLNSNWHQAREAEPKDFDISKTERRDLSKATYKRIGNVTDGSLPNTTYQDHAAQVSLKKDFQEQATSKPMVNLETFAHTNLDRDTGHPQRGFGSVLPRHHPEYNKHHLETTYGADYFPPYTYTPAPERPPDFPDNSWSYRKMHSQFTDTTDYRRVGWNTWADESGVYSNTVAKRTVFQPTNTIPERLE